MPEKAQTRLDCPPHHVGNKAPAQDASRHRRVEFFAAPRVEALHLQRYFAHIGDGVA